jgi:hypothetical protein
MRCLVSALTIAALSLTSSPSLFAQNCPVFPPSGGTAWFEYEVSTRAKFMAQDAVIPYPDASLNQGKPFTSDFALAQFVVDTLGVPIPKSVRLLMQPEKLSADSVLAASAKWRFKPATVHGCVVQQLVQTALRWK